MKRKRKKEKTKKRQENNAPAPAGSRHTSTHHRRRVTRRSGGKDAAGDACDCERVSRRGAKIRGGKVRENLRAALPTPVENPILTPPPWARPDCSKVCASRRCGIVSCQLVGRRSPRGDGRRSPACLIRGYFLRGSWGEIFSRPRLDCASCGWLVASAVCLARSGWGRGPIRHHHHHHIYASSFLLPPQWDLLSRWCELFPQIF